MLFILCVKLVTQIFTIFLFGVIVVFIPFMWTAFCHDISLLQFPSNTSVSH